MGTSGGGGRIRMTSPIIPLTLKMDTSHLSRSFTRLLVIPSILLLIASNPGFVRHVQGRQEVTVATDQNQVTPHPLGIGGGYGQQYASFEELQKLVENPFENNTAINITIPLGDTAYLRCKVRNLGERTISWVRRRDWHILTSGAVTYTNDERFNCLHADGTDDWTLQIKFVQRRDNGTYECQVSTGTGIVSYLVHLHIAVPEAFILGNGEYHIEQGSTINLVCVIEKSPKPPEYIFWYHNERMINYGSSREVTVHTEPGSKTHSRLTIRDAQLSDSGNYTCKTAHAEPASTLVYVSQGDQIAAIQKRKGAASGGSSGGSSGGDGGGAPSDSSPDTAPAAALANSSSRDFLSTLHLIFLSVFSINVYLVTVPLLTIFL